MMDVFLATDKNGFQAVYMHEPIRNPEGYWYDPILDFCGQLPDDLNEIERNQRWEDEPIRLNYSL